MNSKHQQGYVLLALLLVFFVSGSSLMVGVLNNRQSSALREQAELKHQMAVAKEALLAFAANSAILYENAIGPGYLPCPDTDDPGDDPAEIEGNDGLPDTNGGDDEVATDTCPAGTTFGRLPQYVPLPNGTRFYLNDYNAGIDQQFWYAVSPLHLRTASTTSSVNKVDAGQTRLSLDGGENNIVALIIAPGSELETQNRSGNPALYSNYLDFNNGVNGIDYYTRYPANPTLFNDQILTITHDEYMRYVGRAVAGRIKKNLDDDYSLNGDDYPRCLWTFSYDYCHYDSGSTIYSLTEKALLDSITGDWITSEGWDDTYSNHYVDNSPSPYYYDFRYFYWLDNILYIRNPKEGPPYIIFDGCNMRFQLNYGGGVEIPDGYDTCDAPVPW